MAMAFFLGANSAKGFVSLYPEVQREGRPVLVIKGGPGCGKATCIRRLAQALGGAEEWYHCSSDPDSLDGVVAGGKVLLDGTAPHLLEPTFPGCDGDYLTLPAFRDLPGLQSKKEALYALKAASAAHYQGAYRQLAAVEQVREERRQTARALLKKPPRTRAAGLLQRLVPRQQGSGRVYLRFLEGVTPKGWLCLEDTVRACAHTIIAVSDRYGVGEGLLQALREGALERGHRVYACMDPLAPERLRHLLLPDCGVAFVTREGENFAGADRTLHLEHLLAGETLGQERGRLRLLERLERSLLADGVAHLAAAHALHDKMEVLYRPHVDWEAMEAHYRVLAERLG